MHIRKAVRSILTLIPVLSVAIFASAQAMINTSKSEAPPPRGYVAEFVSTAAYGEAMNNAADVTGTSYPDPGCGWQCLPPLETVVWRNGARIVLPTVPGLTGITVTSINAAGWVAGFAGQPEYNAHAVVWKPTGSSYQAIDLGVLPGTDISYARGIDDLGRVVGYSITKYFPPTGAPFMWSEATGLVDLSQQGFPDEEPYRISPGGTVALQNSWYRLGDPNSVVTMAPPPTGFYPPGSAAAAINDAGDQARVLNSTSGEHFGYLFRYHHEGVWQQIGFGFIGSGPMYPYSNGYINISPAKDVTASDHAVRGGVVAYGPDGGEQSLTNLLSPAYQGAEVTAGGPMNSAGQILAQVMIGRSTRLMRLVPAPGCPTICMKVNTLQISGEFIDDPNDPGQCTPYAQDHVVVDLQITTTAGTPLANVLVRGRFFDDYWMNEPVSGVTNANGRVSLVHDGLACVGAVAFLAESAIPVIARGPKGLDKTVGILTGSVIPLP